MALISVKPSIPSNLLKDRFIVPPFSVLDTKQGYWRERVNMWKSIGIKSELGRGDNLTFNLDITPIEEQKKTRYGKCNPESIGDKYGRKVQATSIFDPVLCELAYKWFSRDGDKVIDPFAGGSVRGIVGSVCGRYYTGIDLSKQQIDNNVYQFEEIKQKYKNNLLPIMWINSDSKKYTQEHIDDKYNFMLTCPPYYDLEVYSDSPEDISNCGTYEEFLEIYSDILSNCVRMLEDDSFAVIVVGNIRNKKDTGYYDFVGDTIMIMQDAGCLYYNDMILVNTAGTLPIRAPLQFNNSRKVGKQHQNVLVFYKGDVKNIKNKFGSFEVD